MSETSLSIESPSATNESPLATNESPPSNINNLQKYARAIALLYSTSECKAITLTVLKSLLQHKNDEFFAHNLSPIIIVVLQYYESLLDMYPKEEMMNHKLLALFPYINEDGTLDLKKRFDTIPTGTIKMAHKMDFDCFISHFFKKPERGENESENSRENEKKCLTHSTSEEFCKSCAILLNVISRIPTDWLVYIITSIVKLSEEKNDTFIETSKEFYLSAAQEMKNGSLNLKTEYYHKLYDKLFTDKFTDKLSILFLMIINLYEDFIRADFIRADFSHDNAPRDNAPREENE